MASVIAAAGVSADPIQVDVRGVAPPASHEIRMGTSRAPDGRTITVDNTSLLRDGRPWLAVMGEFHYSRYPQNEWRDELLKMRAGGIDIVATYVFWIHHEELEGEWDWTGQRDLRKFVQTCQDVGLSVVVRMGPWCHGEVRNGGLPDWILPLEKRLRTEDPQFLAKTRILYQQIAAQLKGLLWKDGGPVIAVQLDNEFHGPASYLLALKKIAIECGIDVPIYTRTAWPQVTTPMPFGAMLPLHGAYAEGFWDRTLEPMPGKYWRGFIFSPQRTDAEVGNDQLGRRDATDAADTQQYPYLTCELGGGMMSSYHRRILIQPKDIEALAIAKVGSGSNLPGYYMYHGGTNPIGKRSTLHESQATNYPNDLPVMSYDFQAPLGEFGQIRETYHRLRRLHLFLRDFGPQLARMPAIFPDRIPNNGKDSQTLRYAIRSDGASAFLFINNHQRLLEMPPRNLDFAIQLRNEAIRLPGAEGSLPPGEMCIWPASIDIAGAKLSAAAQLICKLQIGDVTYVFLSKTPGFTPGTDDGSAAHSKLRLIYLDDAASLTCWKGFVGGRERVVLSRANVIFDGNRLRLRSERPQDLSAQVLPPPNGWTVPEGDVFGHRGVDVQLAEPVTASLELIRPAGPPREIKAPPRGVAQAPEDADFDAAAVYRVKLPQGVAPHRDLLLRVTYAGDVARFYLNGKLLTDHFYNGTSFDLGLKRYAPEIYRGELLLKILPLRKHAPIYLAKEAQPDFGDADSIARAHSVELIETHEVSFDIAG